MKKLFHWPLFFLFISFNVTPIARSWYCANIEGFHNMIVRIELPYEALVNITKCMKLLAHEIYHYMAPANRVERNMLIAAMSLATIMGQIMYTNIRNWYLRNRNICGRSFGLR